MFLLAWIYGCIVNLRNWLFDMDILHSQSYDHPIIGVGNLTVGGTGKTPHTELLVGMMLEEGLTVATLSRGYKRKTHGFRIATAESTADEMGDEPMQMARRYPEITVAVDENRCHGIDSLLREKKPDVIVLDDVFQHRYVKPGLNILLVDYNRPAHSDRMLPAGRLREPFEGRKRADIVIVTKCPRGMTPIDFRVFEHDMALMPFQKLFFSTLRYGDLIPLFADQPLLPLKQLRQIDNALLVSGIANPEQLRQDLIPHCQRLSLLTFPDHHAFTKRDAERINETFRLLPADEKIIITTAKDAVRLRLIEDKLSKTVRTSIYVLPIKVEFLRDEERTFQRIVVDYVRKTQSKQL